MSDFRRRLMYNRPYVLITANGDCTVQFFRNDATDEGDDMYSLRVESGTTRFYGVDGFQLADITGCGCAQTATFDGLTYIDLRQCENLHTLTTFQQRSVTTVLFGDSLKTIKDHCFYLNSSLTTLSDLSGNFTNFEKGCLQNTSLTKLVIRRGEPPTLGTNAFANNKNPIYVPDASVDDYKSAWSSHASRIHPISKLQ